jgi:hypothetical protein
MEWMNESSRHYLIRVLWMDAMRCDVMSCSPIGVAPSCRFSKPRCCTIPSAVDDDVDVVDAAIVRLDAAAAAKPKALVPIELDFKTAHHNDTCRNMVEHANAWNFMLRQGKEARGKSNCPIDSSFRQ